VSRYSGFRRLPDWTQGDYWLSFSLASPGWFGDLSDFGAIARSGCLGLAFNARDAELEAVA
jgi:hypothetical protein